MILRETTGLVAAGLVSAAPWPTSAADLIASRLYGVAPQDPLTLTVATGVLLAGRTRRGVRAGAPRVESWIRWRRCTKDEARDGDEPPTASQLGAL